MKTKIQLLIIILTISLTSCSSDDANTTVPPTGKWLVTLLTIESSFDFNEDGQATRDLFTETDCYNGNFVEFFEDGEVDIDVDLANIFVDTNDEPTFECLNGFTETSTWTQNGSTITVINGGGQGNLIGEMSGNTLTVTVSNGFALELNDPVNGHYPAFEDFTIVFTKM